MAAQTQAQLRTLDAMLPLLEAQDLLAPELPRHGSIMTTAVLQLPRLTQAAMLQLAVKAGLGHGEL